MWKLNKINNENPYAVVLHIENTGYGVIRSLANLGIPIMAFQKDTKRPESKTRLCEKTNFDFNNFNELLSKLIEFSEKCTQKPVLYITSDLYIEFVLDNRDIIDKYYILNYPSNEVIRMLLNKDKFYNYSLEHNLPVPKTYYIQSKEDVNYKIQNFEFPVILKPNYFNKNWGANDLAKTYIINNMDELKYIYTMVSKTQSNVLIQDYIPGPDSNFEYCLIYFNDKSECISSFTGQKIRQWPIGLGSLSITKPTKNEKLKEYTIEFFKKLNYKGFGSLEFKKHSKNNNYYIIEPTSGRPDSQLYIATANNENMPLIAYESLIGRELKNKPVLTLKNDVIYIENWYDIFCSIKLLFNKEMSIKTYYQTKKGEKVYSLLNMNDIVVYFYSFIFIFRKMINKIKRIIKMKKVMNTT